MGMCLIQCGAQDEARAYGAQAYGCNPGDAQSLAIFGFCLSQGGSVQEGVSMLAAAIEREPEQYLWHYLLGLYHLRREQHAEALEAFARAAALCALDAHVYGHMASAHEYLGDLDAACAVLERGIRQCPASSNLYRQLSRIYLAREDADLSQQMLCLAMQRGMERQDYAKLSYLLAGSKKWAESFVCTSASLELEPDSINAVLDFVGQCIALGMYAFCEPFIERVACHKLNESQLGVLRTFQCMVLCLQEDNLGDDELIRLSAIAKNLRPGMQILVRLFVIFRTEQSGRLEEFAQLREALRDVELDFWEAILLARLELLLHSNDFEGQINKALQIDGRGIAVARILSEQSLEYFGRFCLADARDHEKREREEIAEAFYNKAVSVLDLAHRQNEAHCLSVLFHAPQSGRFDYAFAKSPSQLLESLHGFALSQSIAHHAEAPSYSNRHINDFFDTYALGFYRWAKCWADYVWGMLSQADKMIAAGELFAARALLKQMQHKYPHVACIYERHARCLRLMGALDSALQCSIQGCTVANSQANIEGNTLIAARQYAGSGKIYLICSELLRHNNELTFAASMQIQYLESMRRDVRSSQVYLEVAQFLCEVGQSTSAYRVILAGILQFPREASLYHFVLQNPQLVEARLPSTFPFASVQLMLGLDCAQSRSEIMLAYIAQGIPERASRVQVFCKKRARDGVGWFFRAVLALRRAKFSRALRCIDMSIAQNSRRADAFVARARVHVAQRDFAKAELDLTEALRLEPAKIEAHCELAQIYAQSFRYALAVKAMAVVARYDTERFIHALGLAQFNAMWSHNEWIDLVAAIAPEILEP